MAFVTNHELILFPPDRWRLRKNVPCQHPGPAARVRQWGAAERAGRRRPAGMSAAVHFWTQVQGHRIRYARLGARPRHRTLFQEGEAVSKQPDMSAIYDSPKILGRHLLADPHTTLATRKTNCYLIFNKKKKKISKVVLPMDLSFVRSFWSVVTFPHWCSNHYTILLRHPYI